MYSMMKYIVAVVFCLAVVAVSADRHNAAHRRRRPSNNDNSHSQGQEGRWFSVQASSSYWSRTVFRLKDSNVLECEKKCISFMGACMSFDFHKRTGTCYGRPEGAQIFQSRDQSERVHHSNHYDFYYISHDDLDVATQEWEHESPDAAAEAIRAEKKKADYERRRQEEEQERQRAKQRHHEMMKERERMDETRRQQEPEETPESEPEIVEPRSYNRPAANTDQEEFTCVSGVKSYANGRLMSDTTELELCEVRRSSNQHRCYQLSLEMTMNAGVGRQVKTASYTGGCFYPEARSILDQGRAAAARNLPGDINLDNYAFATCNQKNCFDLTQTENSAEPEPEPETVPEEDHRNNNAAFNNDFTCVVGSKSFANGRLMSDTSNTETCENRGYGTNNQCFQVSVETTMKAGGFKVKSQSYTGGCFYPEMRQVLDQGADATAAQLPDNMKLNRYAFNTCEESNCFDLEQFEDSEDSDEEGGEFEYEDEILCPLHGCTPQRLGCSDLKKDENGCTLCECEAEEEEHQCQHNQVWNECGTACPLRCGEEKPTFCTYNCVIGCACPYNMWLTEDGHCVTEDNCPANKFKVEEQYDLCPLHGCTPQGLGCRGEELKKDDNGCTLCECEDVPVPECPHNQVFLECGSACPDRCGEERPVACTLQCVVGCGCPQGLWMTEEGYCVHERDCPPDFIPDVSEEDDAECYQAVGMEDGTLADDNFSAASAYWGYPAHNGRLNGRNAWAPQVTKAGEYLELDFGKRINVVGVATQGKKYYFQDTFVTKYYLEYMDRNGNWRFYNNKQEFDGNSDSDTVKTNFFFDQPIHTRRLRIVVNDWQQQILLRAEVYSDC